MKTALKNMNSFIERFRKLANVQINEQRLEEIKQDYRNLATSVRFLNEMK